MSQFRRVTNSEGRQILVNADYVISLHFDQPNDLVAMFVAHLNSEGTRSRILLTQDEAARVEEWLSGL